MMHWSSFFEDSKPTRVRADHDDEMSLVFGTSSWSNHGAPTLRVQPIVGQALKAHRFQLWMKTPPQKIQELMEAKEKHTEL
ncbi:cocaine esterase [Artibeus jamaicensis]|uniref:cocaine esterase n=1 Tax=Artibeus jamaicensis TaxID=9417 RepID=UPI00235A53AB|nr:cocaine esterase [Artibeus jamaicensis]XP_053522539.1 cocaine esterase [Artibeus jamaicensis]XP_053522540.1 cocaine esterase [Artibeus jamaicensis]